MKLMTLKHYSVCMQSLHTHHVHDMCLRCVGMLRTGVGCDVVICSQPRNLGTQLTLANRDDNTQTNWVDRTVGTCRGNRITGGMIKEAVTGLPLGTQLELSHRDCRTLTLLVDWTYKQHRSAVYMYYPPKWPVFYNPYVPYGRDVVTCFQPRLGTQLELANRDHSILTLLEDRTRGTSRSNRMTGGRIKDAVTGLPRQMGTQLELATRDYRTHTRLMDRTVGTSRGNRMTGGMLSEERVSANAHTLYSWGHRTVRISKAGNRVMTGGGTVQG